MQSLSKCAVWRLREVLFLVVLSLSFRAEGSQLVIRFLDVGQGDAILLQDGEHAALVDAGPPSDDIMHKLSAFGLHSLEIFVASHNHDDHIGGAAAVLTAMPVGVWLDNGWHAATAIQHRVLSALLHSAARHDTPAVGSLMLGDTRLRFLMPEEFVGGDPQNNRSVVVLVEHGTFRALLSGDAEVGELKALLSAGVVPHVDVLKAAHHGSRNGLTPLWIQQTHPSVVVISVGSGNLYGHPNPMALRYYATARRTVLRTDEDGDVTVKVDDDGAYAISTQRRGAVFPVAEPASRASP